MKALTSVVILLTMMSCGKRVEQIVGTPGTNGESCYAEQVVGGTEITCGESTSFIPNGVDGEDGEDGSFEGYVDYIEVCENIQPNAVMKETLLFVNGKYMAFLSDSNYKKQRLVLLSDDVVYETTDGRNVRFKILEEQIICLP